VQWVGWFGSQNGSKLHPVIHSLGRQPTAHRYAASSVEGMPLVPVRDRCSPSRRARLGPRRELRIGRCAPIYRSRLAAPRIA
jgi:hypothetical protein